MRHSAWELDPDLAGRAKSMFLSGLSASQVAKHLGRGLTRNAVLGKLFRMNVQRGEAKPLVRNPYPIERRPYRRGGSASIPKPNARPPKAVAMRPAETIPLNPRPWITRTSQECAFPVGGQGADTMSCCNQTGDIGTTYCPHHQRIMWAPSQPKAKDDRKLARLAA